MESTIVKRWFMKTQEGEILDGPYKVDTPKEQRAFDKAVALYIKLYKYVPVLVEEEMDSSKFTQAEDHDVCGLPTGKHTGGRRELSCLA